MLANVSFIGSAVGWCATKMLDYHIAVVEWFGGMREFLVEIPKYQGWVWGIYGIITVVLFFCFVLKKRKKKSLCFNEIK